MEKKTSPIKPISIPNTKAIDYIVSCDDKDY
jgi:hypothetical protein